MVEDINSFTWSPFLGPAEVHLLMQRVHQATSNCFAINKYDKEESCYAAGDC